MKNIYKPLHSLYCDSPFGTWVEFFEDYAYVSDGYKMIKMPIDIYNQFWACQKPCFPAYDEDCTFRYYDGIIEGGLSSIRSFMDERGDVLSATDTRCIVPSKKGMTRVICTEEDFICVNNEWFEKHVKVLSPRLICATDGSSPVYIFSNTVTALILPVRVADPYAHAIWDTWKGAHD